jgi:hypothetical protein
MRRMLSLQSLCLTAALLAAPALLQAQIVYKWTDKSGVVHYSDQPPPEEAGAERFSVRAAAPASRDGEDDAKPTEQPVSAACATVRQNLLVFENSDIVRMDLDGDGEAEELTPEQRERELARTRELVKTLCDAA